MLCKYYLHIGSVKVDTTSEDCIDVTDMVANMADVKMSVDRDDLGGITKKLSNTWEFVGKAHKVLVDYYNTTGLKSIAAILVQGIENDWSYTDLWECPLDFATFRYDSNKASINCVQNNAAALIKANKSTDYEYKVEDICEDIPLLYEGVKVEKSVEILLSGLARNGESFKDASRGKMKDLGYYEPQDDREIIAIQSDTDKNWTYTLLPIYRIGEYKSRRALIDDQHYTTGIDNVSHLWNEELDVVSDDESFAIEALNDVTINIDTTDFDVQWVGWNRWTKYPGYVFPFESPSHPLVTEYGDSSYLPLNSSLDYPFILSGRQLPIRAIVFTKGVTENGEPVYKRENIDYPYLGRGISEINLKAGQFVMFATIYPTGNTSRGTGADARQGYDTQLDYYIINNGKIRLTWGEKADNTTIKVIKPEKVLEKLMESIGGETTIYSKIFDEDNERLRNTKIIAAESIRNLESPLLTTKFSDFVEFMSAEFGYVYEINPYEDGERVEFRHRDDLFDHNKENAKSLLLTSQPEYQVESGRIYSEVEVGHEKQDYDEANTGKYEFNFISHYTTGITLTDKKLSLISPYRADSYGIEELVLATSINEQKDDDSDVFVIKVSDKVVDGQYRIERDGSIVGTYDDTTAFNSAYCPMAMLKANASLIAMFTNLLTFASTEGNSDVSIKFSGTRVGNSNEYVSELVGMSSNIGEEDTITSGWFGFALFKVGSVNVQTNDLQLPANINGLVSFVWGERIFFGYVDSVDAKFGKEEVMEYSLIEYDWQENVHIPVPETIQDYKHNRRVRARLAEPTTSFGDLSSDFNNDFTSDDEHSGLPIVDSEVLIVDTMTVSGEVATADNGTAEVANEILTTKSK